jgi:dolichyl-phosphate-mannose--protein O-mannosyl transferase
MKKIKQLLALAGVVVLVGLYAATLICALSQNENYMNLLMASVYATVIIPVLLWAYSFIYSLLKKNYGKNADDSVSDDAAADKSGRQD